MGTISRSRGWCGWLLAALVLALVVGAVVYKITRNSKKSHVPAPIPGPPGAIARKYADPLKVAMQFFDVQKSGKLVNNNIKWRGDSALQDGDEAKTDLSKGMYDAGDHIKFGLPLAFTATVLSWAILEYGDQMDAVKQLDSAHDSLKWITDFLINAHVSQNVLYVQVGDAKKDHECWERPEDMSEDRPLIQVNTSFPGSEVAAETAAALASASLVYRKTDAAYSSTLLKHAKQLFTFADTHRGSYSMSIPDTQSYYNSTGYEDELLWAAAWLYHSTKNGTYLDYVTGKNADQLGGHGGPSWFSWDNKLAGAQVLLSRLALFGKSGNSELDNYREAAEAVMCSLLPGSPTATPNRTKGGLIWISEWNSLQHPVASAFLATLYSDYLLSSATTELSCNDKSFKPSDLRKFAMSQKKLWCCGCYPCAHVQADYLLGNNPMKMSYLVGYGNKFPKYVHHRGASIPADATTGCKDGWKWLESPDPNPNVATGALVGGPFLNETYVDSRNNSMQGEPTTYNSAVLVGLLSGLVTTSSVTKSFT